MRDFLPANQREAALLFFSLLRVTGGFSRRTEDSHGFVDRLSIVTAPLVLMLESLMGSNLIT